MEGLDSRLSYLPVIDSLRAIAASIVCFCHIVCFPKGFINNSLAQCIFGYGRFGVQIFFVISGIVIPMAMYNANYHISKLPRFLGKRLIRIEPPYLFSVALMLGILYVRSFAPGIVGTAEHFSLRDILLHIGYLTPFVKNAKWILSVYWTLAIEFQYYILISLSFSFIFSKSIYKRLLVYILFLCSGLFVPGHDFVIVWLPIFLVGIAYVLYISGTIKLPEYIAISLVSFIFICYLPYGIADLIASIFTIFVIHFFGNARNHIFRFVGNISYSLYLTHVIFGITFINYLSHYTKTPIEKLLLGISGYAVSLLCAWIFYMLIEKPSKRLSSKLKYN